MFVFIHKLLQYDRRIRNGVSKYILRMKQHLGDIPGISIKIIWMTLLDVCDSFLCNNDPGTFDAGRNNLVYLQVYLPYCLHNIPPPCLVSLTLYQISTAVQPFLTEN